MSAVGAAAAKLLVELLPLLVQIAAEALKADDPKGALVKAKAAARMAAVKKGRDEAVKRAR